MNPRPTPSRLVAARFRASGLVFTLQRKLVWEALAARHDHPTADELFALLGGPDAGISRTTVYRTLEAFVEAGLAQRVGHLGAAVRFDPRTEPHDHLVCEVCGSVRDWDPTARRAVGAAHEPAGTVLDVGFRVHSVTRMLRGRCADCG